MVQQALQANLSGDSCFVVKRILLCLETISCKMIDYHHSKYHKEQLSNIMDRDVGTGEAQGARVILPFHKFACKVPLL